MTQTEQKAPQKPKAAQAPAGEQAPKVAAKPTVSFDEKFATKLKNGTVLYNFKVS